MERALSLSRRDLLIVALTLVTGATDAIGFTRLGGVFTSVMTGNMVLLGVSAGRGDGHIALYTGVAFATYVLGTLVGGRIAGAPTARNGIWPRSLTRALYAELAAYVVFSTGWEAAGGHPTAGGALALLGVNAVALGIQSSAILRLGVGGLSTTYLTGTLTSVIASFATRDRSGFSNRSVVVLAALIVGAGVGATLAIHGPRVAPLAILVPLVSVIAVAVSSYGITGDEEPAA